MPASPRPAHPAPGSQQGGALLGALPLLAFVCAHVPEPGVLTRRPSLLGQAALVSH